jgi:putative resolvase
MSPARAGRITDLAVTHKERLTRFGFGFLKRSFTGHGVRIHVVVDGGGGRQAAPG